MRKNILLRLSACFLACLFIISAFTGCHHGLRHSEFEIPQRLSDKEMTITFWSKNDTNISQAKIYEKAIADFEALYPNITVELRSFTNYDDIYRNVLTSLSTDTTPNVCITYPDHIATYMTGGNVVVPLDSLMSDPKFGLGGSELKFDGPSGDEMITSFLDECVLDGQHYAVPFVRSSEALYINKTYVEKLGYTIPEIVTWDWIWEVSEDAVSRMNDDGTYFVNGQTSIIPFIYKSTDNMMIQMAEQLGSGFSDDSGKISLFNDTTKELLYEIGSHAKSKAFSTFKISSYPGNWFNAGRCIFAVDSTAGATWIGSRAPLSDIPEDQYVEFETVVKVIPQFDTANVKMISQGPSICIFNKSDPQIVLASWLFTQFLLSNSVQVAYAETEGYVPVTSKAQNSPEYLDYLSKAGIDYDEHYDIKIAASKLIMDNTGKTFITPVFNGSTSLRNAAGQLIEDVCKSERRKETVDEAYMASLYNNVIMNNHLNLEGNASEGKMSLGRLPSTAVILIAAIVCIWVGMGVYVVISQIRKKREAS